MKKISILFKSVVVLAVFSLSGCETFDLNQTDNPSTLPAEKLDPVYVFNNVQLTLPDFVNSANGFTQRVTRQMAMTTGTSYDNAFAPVDSDQTWTTGYLMLNSIKIMEPKAMENGQDFILGASKVIRCYVLMTMVDLYGNIPYSEALQGNSNLTPKYDSSESVYEGIYNELNQALTYLSAASDDSQGALAATDLYYGTGTEKRMNVQAWVTLAKTLKFKMLHTARLAGDFGSINVVNEMNLLLAENDLINDKSKDFAFKYGTERDLPNSRHPLYNDQYELGSGAYIGNYFFWAVSEEKGLGNSATQGDPRERYYFFRQASSLTSETAQTVPCKFLAKPPYYNNDEYASFYDITIKAPYCVSDNLSYGSAYLGRDHGDASGIPLDDDLRSVVGVYPAGGAIGTAAVVNSATNAGLKGGLGEGIMPMVLSSYVHFMKAEAILTLSLAGDARAELNNAINESISKTVNFLPQFAPGTPEAPSVAVVNAQTASYLNFVLDKYDAANDADKLQIIIKEFYIASWGNGIEPYNNYRRTGYPDNFQPTIEENPGAFYYTALYAGASVNNNPNAPTNVRTKKVFWDKANLDLH